MAIQSVVHTSVGQAASSPSNDVATAGGAAVAAAISQAVVQQQAPKPEPAATAKEVQQAADKINKALERFNSSSLEFSVDHDSGRTIVRVLDTQTKDVIRQIPNEETLAISKSLDKLQGLLIRQKA
jgi:flagellar protein FlaG